MVPTTSDASAFHDGIPCQACGKLEWVDHFEILKKCCSCGHIRAAGKYGSADYHEVYSEKYFKGEEYFDYLADEATHRRNFQYRLNKMKKFTKDNGPVFEIGCAYGLFLDELNKRGIRGSGVDICPDTVKHAVDTLKCDAVAGDFLALEIPAGKFPVFCMWDVLEHLPRPELFVERISERLPKDGLFFATTGDIGARFARWRGPKWRMIHPPTHLHYFSHDSIRKMYARYGLEVVEIRSLPIFRSFSGTFGVLSVLGSPLVRTPAKIANWMIPGFLKNKLGFWLDLGDIMWIAARKKA